MKNPDGSLRDEKYATFTKLDAEGKPLWIRDARGNLVMQYIAPLKARRAGDRRSADEDVATGQRPLLRHRRQSAVPAQHGCGRPLDAQRCGRPAVLCVGRERRVAGTGRRSCEHRMLHTTYDGLRRPLEQCLKSTAVHAAGGRALRLRRKRAPMPQPRNLRGQVYRHFDPSGLVTNERFDFKGNLLEVTRRLASAYDAPVIDWPAGSGRHARTRGFHSASPNIDALNRMTRLYNWHRGHGSQVAVYEPSYNERGLLASRRPRSCSAATGATHGSAGRRADSRSMPDRLQRQGPAQRARIRQRGDHALRIRSQQPFA